MNPTDIANGFSYAQRNTAANQNVVTELLSVLSRNLLVNIPTALAEGFRQLAGK